MNSTEMTPHVDEFNVWRSRLPAKAESGVLRDIRVAVKDNICTLELSTTCVSAMLNGYNVPKGSKIRENDLLTQ